MDKLVTVVVPVYKEIPDELEKIALRQITTILNGYRIAIVAPNDIDLSFYKKLGVKEYVTLSPEWFLSVESYSELCISPEFYELFLEYEYILIYQLDAFVFSDKLLEFCDKGYDYIGAPVPRASWEGLPYHVGNGGFSLRKVSKCLEMARNRKEITEKIRDEFGEHYVAALKDREDCFFGFCGYRDDIDFSVPDIEKAFDFSVEFNINGIYLGIENRLPFGCHRWQTYRFNEWWPIISKYGYKISQEKYQENCSIYQWHEYRVLMRNLKEAKYDEIASATNNRFIKNNEVSIWGYGKEGQIISDFLKMNGIRVSYIFDISSDERGVIRPQKERIRSLCMPLMITSTKYEKDIEDYLINTGLQKGKDYYSWKDLANQLIMALKIYQYGEIVH